MIIQSRNFVEKVRDNIVDVIRGSGDIVSTAVTSITEVIEAVVKSTGRIGAGLVEMMQVIIEKAIEGVIVVEGDLAIAVKGIVIGILSGIRVTGKEAFKSITLLSKFIVTTTAKLGGDVAAASVGLIQGTVEGAKILGLDIADAVSEAATAAVKAAYALSAELGDKVQHALTGTIDGTKIVIRDSSKREKGRNRMKK